MTDPQLNISVRSRARADGVVGDDNERRKTYVVESRTNRVSLHHLSCLCLQEVRSYTVQDTLRTSRQSRAVSIRIKAYAFISLVRRHTEFGAPRSDTYHRPLPHIPLALHSHPE